MKHRSVARVAALAIGALAAIPGAQAQASVVVQLQLRQPRSASRTDGFRLGLPWRERHDQELQLRSLSGLDLSLTGSRAASSTGSCWWIWSRSPRWPANTGW
jgi:hypothetical protein